MLPSQGCATLDVEALQRQAAAASETSGEVSEVCEEASEAEADVAASISVEQGHVARNAALFEAAHPRKAGTGRRGTSLMPGALSELPRAHVRDARRLSSMVPVTGSAALEPGTVIRSASNWCGESVFPQLRAFAFKELSE